MKKRTILRLVVVALAACILISASPGAIAPIMNFMDIGSVQPLDSEASDRLAGLLLMAEALLVMEFLRRNPIFVE